MCTSTTQQRSRVHSVGAAKLRAVVGSIAYDLLAFRTGTMSIFAGRVSLHCVTEVLGAHPRFVAVLAFNSKPGVMNGDEVRQLFWGRTS